MHPEYETQRPIAQQFKHPNMIAAVGMACSCAMSPSERQFIDGVISAHRDPASPLYRAALPLSAAGTRLSPPSSRGCVRRPRRIGCDVSRWRRRRRIGADGGYHRLHRPLSRLARAIAAVSRAPDVCVDRTRPAAVRANAETVFGSACGGAGTLPCGVGALALLSAAHGLSEPACADVDGLPGVTRCRTRDRRRAPGTMRGRRHRQTERNVTDTLYDGIIEYKDYTGNRRESCDAVVIGSGPTGAVAAWQLVDRGLDVILLEAGPVRRPQDFTLDGAKTLAEVCYEGGLRAMRGKPMVPTMQARVLGGGSHINSAICVRTPQFCFDDWRERYGVDWVDRATLDPHYDRVEAFLGVGPTPADVLGRKNELFRDACNALGIHSEPMPRNVRGCCGCAECFTGCPTRAKQSMDISYIPDAVRKGMRVFTSAQVVAIDHDGRQASGVRAIIVDPSGRPSGHELRVDAKKVILAAGCLATPVLLQKSNVPDPHKQIGKGLQAHPGCALMGIFPDPVDPWFGATQGYQSLEYLRDGFKMETLWAPPAILAVRLPGFGKRLKEYYGKLRYSAFWDSFFALKHSQGRVRARPGRSFNPDVTYRVDRRDIPTIKTGLIKLAELFWAAGAEELLPGIYGVPEVVTRDQGLRPFEQADLKPEHIVLAATHLFSSTRMGPDPKTSVVDPYAELHHLKNCHIVDTGIMPRSPAVNPMLTGMALADRLAGQIAERM
ncbi:MAG: GMC family oxidoreductase [Candidatus Dadabacteria bacterium]|nr:MAG: GMC family oxidoreductase [Candidatus Dadabacteria bacterium]